MDVSLLEALSVTERGFTALFSGFNVGFFLIYPQMAKRRRVGASVLALVNLAFWVEAVYFGLLPSLMRLDLGTLLSDPRVRLLAGVAPLLASGVMTLLVMRRFMFKKRR